MESTVSKVDESAVGRPAGIRGNVVTVCVGCHKIQDEGKWHEPLTYESEALQDLCPECDKKLRALLDRINRRYQRN